MQSGVIRIDLFVPDDSIDSMGLLMAIRGDGRGFSDSAGLEESRATLIIDFERGRAILGFTESCRSGVE